MVEEKNPEEMSKSELQEEMEALYKKINDLDKEAMEQLSFDAKMKIKKKNEDGEVVDEQETSI